MLRIQPPSSTSSFLLHFIRRRCSHGQSLSFLHYSNNKLRQITTRTTVVGVSSARSFATSPSSSNKKAAVSSSPLIRSSPSLPPQDRLIVVGSGVAGSAVALIAADTYKLPVTMVYAGNTSVDCNSYWAQGGIIYKGSLDSNDSPELLCEDIHRAGAGLCDEDAVYKVATEGPSRVEELLLQYAQVPFDRNSNGEYSLCLEASHAAPRILHTADHTGKRITQCLAAAVAQHPLIELRPHSIVVDLLLQNDDSNESECVGITTLDRKTGKFSNLYANSGVVLASGGLAGIYQHSTNPAGFNALGSSVALAKRAGALTQDLEFVQFHPTSLYIPNQPRFLLSEALRGEGALLRTSDGRAFARDYHEDGELAPRDVVARAVFRETSASGQVYLDITHRDSNWLHERFPSIQEYIGKNYNLNLGKDWLPVIPAAHYTCGGIATDLHGRTNIKGLFAAGEAARTGLHGGNRLASTSLLEGLVFGASVADYCATEGRNALNSSVNGTSATGSSKPRQKQLHKLMEPIHIETAAHRAMQMLRKIRKTMWDQVGVVRTRSGLANALTALQKLQLQSECLYATCPTLETAAVRDAAHAGLAVTEAAFANPVSVGAHCIVAEEEDEESSNTGSGGGGGGDGGAQEDSDEEEGAVAAAR